MSDEISTVEVEGGHFIRVRYHGPTNTRGSHWGATWKGWHSPEGRKPVRRSYAYTDDHRAVAQEVAADFALWLSEGGEGAYKVRRITMTDMDGSDYALIVNTDHA